MINATDSLADTSNRCPRCGRTPEFLETLCSACLAEDAASRNLAKEAQILDSHEMNKNLPADERIPYSPGGLTELIAQKKGRANSRRGFKTKCEFCGNYYHSSKDTHLETCVARRHK